MATLSVGLSGSALVTGTKNYTISDTDLQKVLDWAQIQFFDYIQLTFNQPNDPQFVPTNQQILLAWIQCTLINPTKSAVLEKIKRDAVNAATGVAIS